MVHKDITMLVKDTWDDDAEAFIPPKIFDNFILDTETYKWIPPIPYPTDGEHYVWDNESNQWVMLKLLVMIILNLDQQNLKF